MPLTSLWEIPGLHLGWVTHCILRFFFLALICFSKYRVGWYLELGCEHFLFRYMMLYKARVTDIVVLQPPKY
jgi:hypothetical protein